MTAAVAIKLLLNRVMHLHMITANTTWKSLTLTAVLLLSACGPSLDSVSHKSRAEDRIKTNADSDTRKIPVASGVTFRSQQDDGTVDRIVAETISVSPRAFGPFKVNGVNELLVENSIIDVYPKTRSDSAAGNENRSDFTDFLRQYAKSLEDIYGLVTRLHMSNVQITMHGVGKDNGDVVVVAKHLVKEFRQDERPELISLEVSDSQSTNTLKLARAIWNTNSGKLITR
jgi:hypothetical protein